MHSSFELKGREWEGVRESIEVRALVFDELDEELRESASEKKG